jgi:apolipoprotein N-acyltransferase
VFAPAVLSGALGRPGPRTLYTRLGDWPGVLCALGLALLALDAWRRGARRVVATRK